MSETDNGIVRIPSRHTVAETMERLQALLKEPGTPLMVESPVAGLDLPLKALAWEDAEGKTWIAYNDPAYIVRRHRLTAALGANLAAAAPVVALAAGE